LLPHDLLDMVTFRPLLPSLAKRPPLQELTALQKLECSNHHLSNRLPEMLPFGYEI
jgi:hypothetical protein